MDMPANFRVGSLTLAGGYSGTLTLTNDLVVDVFTMDADDAEITGANNKLIVSQSGATEFGTSWWAAGTISVKTVEVKGDIQHFMTFLIGSAVGTADVECDVKNGAWSTIKWINGDV